MSHDNREWLCVGRTCWKARAPLRWGVTGPLKLARAAFPQRVVQQRWIRYQRDLADTPPPPPSVRLTRVSDAVIGALRIRPDRAETALKAGLRLWDAGMQRAYVWIGDDGPLCIQWLLTAEDNRRLRRLSEWSGLYPPVPARWGQVDNLFVFAAAQLGSVATCFSYALFEEARATGLRGLITHVPAGNLAARQWAECAGWRRYGTITRYQVGWPPLLVKSVYLHRNGGS